MSVELLNRLLVVDLPSNSIISWNATEPRVAVAHVTLWDVALRRSLVEMSFSHQMPPCPAAKVRALTSTLPPTWGSKCQKVAWERHTSRSQVGACGLRLKAVCCFFFFFFQRFDALLYVCWPRLFSTAALPLQGRGRDITLSIRPYCLRRLQPRQRDLSLWFMHQVNIVLSCLVWSAAYISCPTFI